jgi:hypothetical protein
MVSLSSSLFPASPSVNCHFWFKAPVVLEKLMALDFEMCFCLSCAPLAVFG